MKKLVFLGIAAMNASVCAHEENGYVEKLKKETDWLISEIKSVSKDLCSLVSSKKKLAKNKEKESKILDYGLYKQAEPVILESCDHCKELCA
jgi:hypothetical protein